MGISPHRASKIIIQPSRSVKGKPRTPREGWWKTSTNIAWGITGAGHYLRETFDVMGRVAASGRVRFTVFLSPAGAQLISMYGLEGRLRRIADGSYLREVLTEAEEGAGSPRAGRFVRGVYRALVVSPASGNTVAKIAHGIADTLVTNAVAQAGKGGVPVYIVPTDQERGVIETTLLYRVERSECRACQPCPVVAACPHSAVGLADGIPRINLALCRSCGVCVAACPFGAVRYGEKVRLRVREVDLQNVERLRSIEGITVLREPKEIEDVILGLTEG